MTNEQIRAHVRKSFWQHMSWAVIGMFVGLPIALLASIFGSDKVANLVNSIYGGFLGIALGATLAWGSQKRELPSDVETARKEILVWGPAIGHRYKHRGSGKVYLVLCCAIDKRSSRAVVVHSNEQGEVFTRTLADWREKDDRGTPRFIGL